MPKLITDLAIMLLTAAVIAVIFKRIKQPLVLGYILVGFLVGPFMPYFFTVEDSASIETWSEIGIIVLMFGLGLEFNLHKLISVGKTAVVTALVQVFGLLVLGYILGQALGWGMMDSIFLGGMLSMSSTTIIIKVFDELKVPKDGYSKLVFGTLVIEDIAGIFMMIILATVSVSKNISGKDLALQLGEMVLYLALWLIIGIFVLPTILRASARFMNDEVLLIMSLGICFAMVLIADRLGFSSALGAFLSGSLLAGTVLAEKVEHLTSGIKDLFGAVFFLSVGMMINPAMLIKYVIPIVIITIVTIVAKVIITAIGIMLSGQTLKNGIYCGCAMAQIGEFAFIIASLGMSLGVIGEYLYPIIVAVSVVTTLTTPLFIKAAPKIVSRTESILPDRLLEKLNRYTEDEPSNNAEDNDWSNYIRRYIRTAVIYGVLMAGVALLIQLVAYPFLKEVGLGLNAVRAICIFMEVIGIGLFVRPMLDFHSTEYTTLWVKDRHNRLPLMSFTAMRFVFIVFIAFFPLQTILKIPSILLLILIAAAIIIMYKTGWMSSAYIFAEARFMANLNERTLAAADADSKEWLDDKLFVDDIVPEAISGQNLKELNWGRRFSVNIFKIVRGKKHINMPNGDFVLEAGDEIYVVGKAENIRNLKLAVAIRDGSDDAKVKASDELLTLRDFISRQSGSSNDVFDYALPINRDSDLHGKSIRDSNIRENYDCMVIGMQRGKLPILLPRTDTVIQNNDIIWILGSEHMAEKMLIEY